MTIASNIPGRLARVCAVLALSALTCAGYAAETYPSKPGRLIVPFGTGASTDIVARIFAAKFSEVWGQPMVVENRPGSGGVVGTEIAARANADGHTMLVYGINQTITPWMYKKLPYDNMRDFDMISLYCTMPNLLIVSTGVAAKTVNDFIALARSGPGNLRYVSSGIGATPHLTMELLKTVTKVDILHVPYKSAAQGYVDLASGQLHAMFVNLPGGLLNVSSGRVRGLAVTSAKRAEQLPNIPTFVEAGYPDILVTVWQGITVPKGTPKPIADQIHASMMKALNAPDLKQRFYDQGVTAAPVSREEFLQFINSERTRWAKVVKDAKVPVE